MPNIAVLYSAVCAAESDAASPSTTDAPPPEPVPLSTSVLASRADNVRVAREVAQALRSRGHAVTLHGVWGAVPISALAGVDAVLNLMEGLEGESSREAEAAQQLLTHGIPFSGSPPEVLRRCQRKELCRSVLLEAGVPVPRGRVLTAVPDHWPKEIQGARAIVKPAWEDASEGIDAAAVVTDLRSLQAAADRVVNGMRQPALLEQFIEGREITASLLGTPPRVLPLGEIDFTTMKPGMPHIVSYAAKWCPESDEYQQTPSVACTVDTVTAERVMAMARTAAAALGLLDIARLDLRLDARGGLYVIDVNPNCDLAPDAGFAKAGARAGLSHAELLDAVMARALAQRREAVALRA